MTSRKPYLFGLLFLLFLPSLSHGQVGYTTDEQVTGDASGTLYSAVVPLAFPRSYIFARGDFGDRPGVLDNYFATGGFMPMQFHGPDEVFYLEGQVWLTEQNEKSLVGGNFGVGNRWLIRDFSQMVGINAFLAWDQKGSGNNYDGAGVGVEWLSDYLGVTANAYIPWNRRVNKFGNATPIKEMTHFTGSNLAYVTLQPVEEQLLGADFEIGSAIPRAEWLSLFGGAYYFDAKQGNDFSGISGRAQLDFTSAIVNLAVTDDDRFGTSVNLTGELRLGDGPLDFTPRYRTLDNQMFDRARRQARIQTLQYIAQGEEIAINPANGLPFEFIHVDNTAAPGGDGTFESRFNQLDDASNMPTADIILAYSGNTEHGGPHLNANGGLVLEDNQIVLGEGYNFLLETANFPGLPCPLPDFAIGATDNPYIAGNAGADLITLANNNQILGLNMLAPTGGNAIVGTDITNTVIDEINRDVIFGVENTGAGGGILLTNIGGTADITNIGFDITDPAAAGGIVINNTDTADLTLTINNDLMKFPGLVVMGGQTGIGIAADNSNIAADIDNINNSDSETGIAIVGRNAANITAVVDNSNFTDSTGDGLNVDLDMSTATAMFTNGSFDNSGDAAGDNAIDVTLTDNSVFNLGLTNITGDNAFDDGIFGSIDDGSQLTIVANDTSFSGAQNGDGLDIDATMGSIFSGSFINGSFADAGGNGISLDFDGMGTTGVLTLDNVPLDNAGLNALEVIADNNAVVTVTGDGISGSGAGEDGIHLDADNTATIGVVLTNTGSFAGAGNDGVDLTNDNGGRIILNATGEMGMPIDFSGATTGNGLISTANGLGTRTDIDLVSGANFDNAAIDAINISSNAGAFTTLDGTMISGANAGDDGIQLSSNAGRIDVNITQAGSFANAGQAGGGTGDGIDIFNEAGGRITLNLAGDGGSIIDFSGAEQNGLVSNTDGDGTVTGINLSTGAMFDNAGEDAINLTSTDLGITQLVGSMVSGSNAGDDGIDLNNDGGMINLQLTNTGSFANAGQNLLGGGDGIDSVNDNGGVTAINISGAGGMPVDFSGAELDGLYSSTGLNASTDIDFNTGAMFDNAGNHAIHLEANDAAGVSLTGDNVSGSMAGSHGILINAENSAGVVSTGVDVNLTNTGSFAGAGGDGLQFNGTDGADININIAGTAMTPADFSGAAVRGVNGNLDASMGILTLTNTNFNGPLGSDGMFIDANNDSVFVGTITDSTFNDATMGDGIEVNMDGSAGMLTLTNVDANNAGDNGLMLRADDTLALGSSTLDVNLNNVNLNSATSDAINVIAMDGGYIDIDGTDVDGMDAGDMGVQLSAIASRIDFTLNSTGTNNFTNSGDTGLVFNGSNMATINVNVSDTNFDDTVPGGFGINGSLTDSVATLNLTDVTANNAEFAGLRVRADNSTVSGTLSNVELNDAGTDAIFIQGLLGADVDFTMSDISGLRAGDDGFDIVTTDAMTDVNIQIDDSDFSNSTNNGLEFDFRSSSNITFNSDTGLTVNMAGADSLNLFGDTLATADIDITNGSLMPAFDDMTDATIMGGAIGDVLIDPTSAAGAGDNGLEFNVTTGGQLNFTLGSPMGPDPDSPLSTTMDPVGSNGVIGTIDAGTVNLTFNNSDINSDGSSTGDGINVTGTNASTFNLDLNNSDVNGWGNGNGIIVAMTDSTAGINFNGSTVNDAGLNAIDLTSNGTSTIDVGFDANGTTIQNTGGTAINALANGGTINFDSPGFLTVDTTGGQGIALNAQNAGTIDFQAMNGLTIDGAGQAGLLIDAETGSMVTVDAMGTMANPLLIQNSGGQGVAVNADGDSMVDVTLRNGSIQGNGTDPMFLPGHGIQAVANGDMVMGDGSLINLTLMDIDITGNTGDGVNLVANMGDNTMMGMPITSGINYSHNGGTIGNNALPPTDGVTGFGISATANGGGMGSDTIIGLSLNNVSVLSPPQPPGNEEGAINLVMNNGGVIIQDITGGELSGPVMVCADGNGSFASLSLDNVLIKPSVDGAMDPDAAAIVLKAINDGSVEANFSNMTGATAISGHGAQAVAFLADTGGQINATFTNIEMNNNLLGLGTLTGPLPAGHPDEPIFTGVGFGLESVVQGLVQNSGMAASSANVTFTDVNIFDNAGANAFEVDVLNGGQLNLTVDNMTTFNNGAQAGEGEFQVNVEDAGSVATINIDGLTANDSGGIGVNLISSGGGAFNIEQLNDITANNATEGGFVLQGDLVDNGDALNPTVVTLSNSSFNNAMGGEGVLIGLNTSGETELNVTNVMANNANAAALFGGVDLVLNNNGVGGDQTINVTNVQSNDSTGVGLYSAIIGLDATSTGSINVTGSSFNNATEEGILTEFVGAPGSTVTIDITNTNAMNAGADGFGVDNMGAAITDISLDTVNVSGAGDNGVDITVANQIVPINVSLDAVTADDTDSTGILIDLDNITGGDSAVSIANSTANNTMMGTGGGIDINLDGVTGGTQAISLDNVSAQNAAGVDGLDITVANTVATDIVDIDITGSNFDGAAMTGVDINVTGPAISNIDMTDTTANMAGLGGVDINLADAQDMSSITLSNVDAVGSMGGNGLLVDATLAMGATIDVGINGGMGGVSDFSNSSGNGVLLDITGDATNTINLSVDGLTANKNGGDGFNFAVINGETVDVKNFTNVTTNENMLNGIDLQATNGSKVEFDSIGGGSFGDITSTGNQENGMNIEVNTGAMFGPVDFAGANNLSNNSLGSANFHALNIDVRDSNSSAELSFNDLTIANTALDVGGNPLGGGINLAVQDMNASLIFNLNDSLVQRSVRSGIRLNATNGGDFEGTFKGVEILDNGVGATTRGEGFIANIQGANTTAEIVFSDVHSDNNSTGSGYLISVESEGSLDLAINDGTSGNGNANTGMIINADGMNTNLTVTSTGANVFSNNMGMDVGAPVAVTGDGGGIEISLTDQVTAGLGLSVSATGNAGDGVSIVTDNSSVDLTMLSLNGGGLAVDGNAGNGLRIDLDNLANPFDFILDDFTINNNGLSQADIRLANMSVDNIFIGDENDNGTGVSVASASGTGDGVRLSLDNMTVNNNFSIHRLSASGNVNSGHGLNIEINDSTLTNPATITESTFTSNGQAGARVLLENGSQATFQAFQTVDGVNRFTNNFEEGMLFELHDEMSSLDINNFYGNLITNNMGIGLHIIADEPLQAPNDLDMIGPSLNVVIGDSARTVNTITGNRDAAVALDMRADSTGTFSIENSILAGTLNGADAKHFGDGLAVLLSNGARLTGLELDGAGAMLNLNNNAGSGLRTNITDVSEMTNFVVLNSLIEGNQQHGISVERMVEAVYTNGVVIGGPGEGNIIRNNALNGINIVHSNSPLTLTMDLDITGNQLSNNRQDGIFVQAKSDGRVTGNITDNDITLSQVGRDGIHFQIDNDADLGSELLANEFFSIDGNFINQGALGRDGIHFDINRSVGFVAGPGNAFAHVLINDSLTRQSQIINSGRHGVTILDDSGFSNPGGPITQSRYRINDTLILNSVQDGVHVEQRTINPQFVDSRQGGVSVELTGSDGVGANGMRIVGSGNNGVDFDFRSAAVSANEAGRRIDNVRNNVLIQNARVTSSGNNGVDFFFTDSSNTGVPLQAGGANIQFGGDSADYVHANGPLPALTDSRVFVQSNTNDGIHVQIDSRGFLGTTNRTVTNTTMKGTEVLSNGGRGLFVSAQHDAMFSTTGSSTPSDTSTRSVWVIGDLAAPFPSNRFNNNMMEGVIFDTQARAISQNVFTGTVATARTRNNPDVFVLVNVNRNPNNGTRVSSQHFFGDILNPNIDPSGDETRRRVTTDVEFYNNQVNSNGTSEGRDGLVFSVGTLTRMNARIQANQFDGNGGFDVNIFPVHSNELVLPTSIDVGAPTADDRIVYDPVAYMDVIFGGPLASDRNSAQSVQVLSNGTNTSAITQTGIINQADAFKATVRPVYMMGLVRFDSEWQTSFEDNQNPGSFLDLPATGLADFINGTFATPVWPDMVFPPSP
ncbi:inverse autotransporter beta domain-containing protein [Thalassoglobus sp.]|uniref:beta strand repeat-containing protein n=1 Tax=Thalassoglobus sp. TaxID=2795869 RepID=UPI003AA84976